MAMKVTLLAAFKVSSLFTDDVESPGEGACRTASYNAFLGQPLDDGSGSAPPEVPNIFDTVAYEILDGHSMRQRRLGPA